MGAVALAALRDPLKKVINGAKCHSWTHLGKVGTEKRYPWVWTVSVRAKPSQGLQPHHAAWVPLPKARR